MAVASLTKMAQYTHWRWGMGDGRTWVVMGESLTNIHSEMRKTYSITSKKVATTEHLEAGTICIE